MQPLSFEALWKRYVPRDGPPPSVRGKALRAIARVGHEVNIANLANWDQTFNELLDSLKDYLGAGEPADSQPVQAVMADLDAIRRYVEAKPANGPELAAAVLRVRTYVIGWCSRPS